MRIKTTELGGITLESPSGRTVSLSDLVRALIDMVEVNASSFEIQQITGLSLQSSQELYDVYSVVAETTSQWPQNPGKQN